MRALPPARARRLRQTLAGIYGERDACGLAAMALCDIKHMAVFYGFDIAAAVRLAAAMLATGDKRRSR